MVGESIKNKIMESLSHELSGEVGFNSSILEEKVFYVLHIVSCREIHGYSRQFSFVFVRYRIFVTT